MFFFFFLTLVGVENQTLNLKVDSTSSCKLYYARVGLICVLFIQILTLVKLLMVIRKSF